MLINKCLFPPAPHGAQSAEVELLSSGSVWPALLPPRLWGYLSTRSLKRNSSWLKVVEYCSLYWSVNLSVFFSGLLVVYCHRFDILTQSSRIYFVACTIGTYINKYYKGCEVEMVWLQRERLSVADITRAHLMYCPSPSWTIGCWKHVSIYQISKDTF